MALKTGKGYGILLVIEVVIVVTEIVVGKGTRETAVVYNLIITDK